MVMEKYLTYFKDLDDKEFRIFICYFVFKFSKSFIAKTTKLSSRQLGVIIKKLNNLNLAVDVIELIGEADSLESVFDTRFM